jgi:23S rRNA (pseudouridine1915-N3)-methyltransferase
LKLDLIAVGRLGRTAENGLCADYLARATAAGKALGLGPAELIEVEARGGSGMAREAEAISAKVAAGAIMVACDERGQAMSSRAFAGKIEKWRDGGAPRLCLVIGGADGLDPSVRERAALLVGFGAWTWPHALARVMAAEQLYRAVTILGGSPYHRD